MDYLHRFNLITQPWSRDISLSGVSQKDMVEEGREGVIQSVRKMFPTLANFKDGRRGSQTKECGWFLAAENHILLKANKKMGTSDLPSMELHSGSTLTDLGSIFSLEIPEKIIAC